ncbi:serine hydrolase [Herbidospora cretacea]|uniref:serine hydrolase n=1 Tax=Herbidospora cretacea TaxID=28444 RepID=UPI000772DD9A|nr:serine hydrolase [Herbidospora cretacea]
MRTLKLIAPLVLLLGGCATAEQAAPANTPKAATSGASTGVAIPDSAVGRKLTWYLGALAALPIPEEQINQHFAPSFLKQVPAAQINEVSATLQGLKVVEIQRATETDLVTVVQSGANKAKLTIAVDPTGKIAGLFVAPSDTPTPASWGEIDNRLAVLPPSSFLAAGEDCEPVHGVAADEVRPLGSMFKLYVLGAVAQEVKAGRLAWDDELTVTDEKKSLPSGELQDRPDGTKVPVKEAAKLMISISDNTATDLLIDRVGKPAVEGVIRAWSSHADRNIPLLTTRELFVLKGADYPKYAEAYLRASDKRAYLEDTVDRVPAGQVKPWDTPREVNTIEWFGSPTDMCRALVSLNGLGGAELNEIMGANDAGLGLNQQQWPTVWFKGGSEPGVLTLGYLAKSDQGKTSVVVVEATDAKKAIPEMAAATEYLALIRGAFGLLRG